MVYMLRTHPNVLAVLTPKTQITTRYIANYISMKEILFFCNIDVDMLTKGSKGVDYKINMEVFSLAHQYIEINDRL